jgi:hypothetical protein
MGKGRGAYLAQGSRLSSLVWLRMVVRPVARSGAGGRKKKKRKKLAEGRGGATTM